MLYILNVHFKETKRKRCLLTYSPLLPEIWISIWCHFPSPWRTCRTGFSFGLSKCLYYTPVVYTDLLCQRFGEFICRRGTPLLWHFISPYFLAIVVTLVCPLNASINRFAVFSEFQLSSWHQLKEDKKLLPLLRIFFPPVSTCFWLLSNVFRWLFLIYCPASIIVTCQSIGKIQGLLPLAEVELNFFLF